MVKDHLERVIAGLKNKWYDTTNLEKQMKEIDNMFAQFQSGSQDFQVDPQQFCAGQQERKDLNLKIKSIMTGIMEEIKKAESQVSK